MNRMQSVLFPNQQLDQIDATLQELSQLLLGDPAPSDLKRVGFQSCHLLQSVALKVAEYREESKVLCSLSRVFISLTSAFCQKIKHTSFAERPGRDLDRKWRELSSTPPPLRPEPAHRLGGSSLPSPEQAQFLGLLQLREGVDCSTSTYDLNEGSARRNIFEQQENGVIQDQIIIYSLINHSHLTYKSEKELRERLSDNRRELASIENQIIRSLRTLNEFSAQERAISLMRYEMLANKEAPLVQQAQSFLNSVCTKTYDSILKLKELLNRQAIEHLRHEGAINTRLQYLKTRFQSSKKPVNIQQLVLQHERNSQKRQLSMGKYSEAKAQIRDEPASIQPKRKPSKIMKRKKKTTSVEGFQKKTEQPALDPHDLVSQYFSKLYFFFTDSESQSLDTIALQFQSKKEMFGQQLKGPSLQPLSCATRLVEELLAESRRAVESMSTVLRLKILRYIQQSRQAKQLSDIRGLEEDQIRQELEQSEQSKEGQNVFLQEPEDLPKQRPEDEDRKAMHSISQSVKERYNYCHHSQASSSMYAKLHRAHSSFERQDESRSERSTKQLAQIDEVVALTIGNGQCQNFRIVEEVGMEQFETQTEKAQLVQVSILELTLEHPVALNQEQASEEGGKAGPVIIQQVELGSVCINATIEGQEGQAQTQLDCQTLVQMEQQLEQSYDKYYKSLNQISRLKDEVQSEIRKSEKVRGERDQLRDAIVRKQAQSRLRRREDRLQKEERARLVRESNHQEALLQASAQVTERVKPNEVTCLMRDCGIVADLPFQEEQPIRQTFQQVDPELGLMLSRAAIELSNAAVCTEQREVCPREVQATVASCEGQSQAEILKVVETETRAVQTDPPSEPKIIQRKIIKTLLKEPLKQPKNSKTTSNLGVQTVEQGEGSRTERKASEQLEKEVISELRFLNSAHRNLPLIGSARLRNQRSIGLKTQHPFPCQSTELNQSTDRSAIELIEERQGTSPEERQLLELYFREQQRPQRGRAIILREFRELLGAGSEFDLRSLFARFKETKQAHQASCGTALCEHLLRFYRLFKVAPAVSPRLKTLAMKKLVLNENL